MIIYKLSFIRVRFLRLFLYVTDYKIIQNKLCLARKVICLPYFFIDSKYTERSSNAVCCSLGLHELSFSMSSFCFSIIGMFSSVSISSGVICNALHMRRIVSIIAMKR